MLNFMLVKFVLSSANVLVHLVVIFIIEVILGTAVPETLLFQTREQPFYKEFLGSSQLTRI